LQTGVGHFKTLFELSGPAASMLKTLTPTQLSIVVEALGKAGTKDLEFFGLVSSQVRARTQTGLPKYHVQDLFVHSFIRSYAHTNTHTHKHTHTLTCTQTRTHKRDELIQT